ncbi:hypothetical protein [Burkholderia cepacia]|uniref:hypothetical protein n=1 Tax=Burkholderia cepacia TaxID=292 RepID=UPI0011463B18|nr:hypothetical protein [Burkholderia cepacia]
MKQGGGAYAEWQALQQRRRQAENAGSVSTSTSSRFKPGSLSSRMLATAEMKLKMALGYKPDWTPSLDPSRFPQSPEREDEYHPDMNNAAIALALGRCKQD